MGRFFFIAAACALGADAVVYTFKDVQTVKGPSLTTIKTVHIRGPTTISVDEFSWRSLQNSSQVNGRAAVVISRAGTMVAHSVKCVVGANAVHEPSLDKGGSPSISMSPVSSMGAVKSYKMAVVENGAYSFHFAACPKDLVQLSAKFSSEQLGAHENGWAIQYAIGALLYAMLFVVGNTVQRGAVAEKHATLISDVRHTSAMLLVMSSLGFILHVLPEKNVAVPRIMFVSVLGAAMANLMMTLLSVAAIGTGVQGRKLNIAWLFFLVCILAALLKSEWAYESVCEVRGCDPKERNISILLPLVAGYTVLCVSGLLCLRRSICCFRQDGSDAGVTFCHKFSAVLAIYVALGITSALLRTFDVPSTQPQCWRAHLVADNVGHLTQFFGMAAVTHIIAEIPESKTDVEYSYKEPHDVSDEENLSCIDVDQMDDPPVGERSAE